MRHTSGAWVAFERAKGGARLAALVGQRAVPFVSRLPLDIEIRWVLDVWRFAISSNLVWRIEQMGGGISVNGVRGHVDALNVVRAVERLAGDCAD